VHYFMILLIISCTKSCGLVAISPCHFYLHHMLLMPCLITLDHITLATLVSLNFQNQTWAFTRVTHMYIFITHTMCHNVCPPSPQSKLLVPPLCLYTQLIDEIGHVRLNLSARISQLFSNIFFLTTNQHQH
jgi:hypothetical protein